MAQGEPQQNFLGAVRRLRSRNQETRRRVANEVLRRLALTPASVRDALHDAPHHVSAGLAQAVYHAGDPDAVHAAAAWTGLLTKDHSLLAFHVHPGGPDSIYKFHLPGGGDDARKTLDAFRVTQRVLLPTPAGFDCLVFDAGRRLRPHVSRLAAHLNAVVAESEGTGLTVGSPHGDAAEARDHFRTLIRRYEQKRPAGQESQNPPAAYRRRPTPRTISSSPRRYAMSDHQKWTEQINADPENMVIRGAYADWLEERGADADDEDLHRLRRHDGPVYVGENGGIVHPPAPGDNLHSLRQDLGHEIPLYDAERQETLPYHPAHFSVQDVHDTDRGTIAHVFGPLGTSDVYGPEDGELHRDQDVRRGRLRDWWETRGRD